MSAFLFIDILLGFENAGIAPNGGVTKKNCHNIAHLRLGPQRLGHLPLNGCVHSGHWVDQLDIFEQQAYCWRNSLGLLPIPEFVAVPC